MGFDIFVMYLQEEDEEDEQQQQPATKAAGGVKGAKSAAENAAAAQLNKQFSMCVTGNSHYDCTIMSPCCWLMIC